MADAPDLLAAAQEALNFLTHAPLGCDFCCCGDLIEAHNVSSGHTPVDAVAYRASQVAESLRAAIAGVAANG